MLRFCAAFVLVLMPLSLTAGPSGLVRVIDADTWELGGERVRLKGIDAPEKAQTCQKADGRDWSCGRWASEHVQARFEGKYARCTGTGKDRYGRTLARCTVDGRDVGQDIVANGMAVAFRRYSTAYVQDEARAARAGRGLHASQFLSPSDFRAATKANMVAAPDVKCLIKGNISYNNGEKIYHLPTQRDYARTRINLAKGERWFCSKKEARIAGWRPAFR